MSQDPCAGADCSSRETCVPINHGPCLALYSKDKSRLPCRQYLCGKCVCALISGIVIHELLVCFARAVSQEKCSEVKYAHVCGEDGKTHASLCHLHKAGVNLAYTGHCRPECSGDVCGRNGVTYPSACHARARNVRIDYSGFCFAEE